MIVLVCCLLLLYAAVKHFSDCDMQQKVDFIQHLAMSSSVFGPRRSSKALPKAKLAPLKMVMVTVWWSAACLIHYGFLNPSKTNTSESCSVAKSFPTLCDHIDCSMLGFPVLHYLPEFTQIHDH